MEPNNKRANQRCRDLTSDLPDDLLCHILSFLSTKEAASTSILSKRWSNLIQSVPILDLDDYSLHTPRIGPPQTQVFNGFVDRLLSLHVKNSSPVRVVSLKCSGVGVERNRIIKWIRTFVDLCVLDLSLKFDFKIFRLPFSVLTSKNLVSLRIGERVCLFKSSSGPVSPFLTSLVLDSVEFGDPNLGFEPVFSAFPALKSLRIHELNKWCYWNGSITSPTLKKLAYVNDDDASAPKHCVSFDTPSLVYLEYSDKVPDKYGKLRFDSLVEARLDLLLTSNQIMRKEAQNSIGFIPGDVTALFMGIRNVKILCLSPDALEALYYRGDTIPKFNNLICLSLGSDTPHGSPYIFWKLLQTLLLESLNLETLIIKGLVHYVQEGWEDLGGLHISWCNVSDILSKSVVKCLEIKGYEGTCREFNQMIRFLGNLSHLEMVKVTHKRVGDGERCRLMKDLMCLPKASRKCKIQFFMK